MRSAATLMLHFVALTCLLASEKINGRPRAG
jgi:hypothetical protein